jgi:hypothetical protein
LQTQPDSRSQARSNVFLSASLVVSGASLPVRVRNLSANGALLEGASLPPPGAVVRLIRGDLTADGEIAWAAAGQAGVRFAAKIDVPAWVKRVGHPGQQRVDSAIAALRRHEPPVAKAQPASVPSLAWVSAELDAICERLAGSPCMTVELGEELVRLDSIARTLQQLASR